MSKQTKPVAVFLELGEKRVFAGASDWPGWCRSARDEAAALEALLEVGPRFGKAMHAAQISFQAPADVAKLEVRERVPGTSTTDFGAPEAILAGDADTLDADELARLQAILQACWAAFDRAAQAAAGRELRKGPRGGGRDLAAIWGHVLGAEQGYLARLGGRRPIKGDPTAADAATIRQAVLDTLAAAARGETPEQGPRGGTRWKPRTFLRRAAWHVLDHAWELEDRLTT